MPLIVQKYGGTSLATPAHVRRVASHIAELRARGVDLAVVVSAMGDSTDQLLTLADAVAPTASGPRELDQLLATGEQVTSALLALALLELRVPATSLTARQAGIMAHGPHGAAEIRRIRTGRMERTLAKREVPIVAGFQGMCPDRDVCTLGRGGSDTTAVALAVALGAERCDIFTDVNGVLTADPRLIPTASVHPRLTYREAMLIALGGAVVLHPRAAAIAANHRMPLRILSSLEPDTGQGTRIEGDAVMEEPRLLGVAVTETSVQLGIDLPSASEHTATFVLRALAEAGLSVQSLSPAARERGIRFDVRVLCSDPDAARASAEHALGDGARVVLRHPLARVCLVGTGLMRSGAILSAALEALASRELPVEAVDSTDLGIAFQVDPAIVPSVVRVLHDRFVSAQPGRPEWSGSRYAGGPAEETWLPVRAGGGG